jgi:hypothetical protein
VLSKLDWLYPDVPEKTEVQRAREKVVFERVILQTPVRTTTRLLSANHSAPFELE